MVNEGEKEDPLFPFFRPFFIIFLRIRLCPFFPFGPHGNVSVFFADGENTQIYRDKENDFACS